MIRDISEIQKLATKYSKPQLARMAQMGLIDPTKAVMAGMMIDRITKSNMRPPTATVADEALAPAPMAAPQGMASQQPAGIGGLPPQAQPNAGVAALPSGITEMAGGGIVAFDEGGEVPGYAGDKESVVRYKPGLFESGFQFPEDSFFGAFQRNTLPIQESPAVRNARELNRIEKRLSEPNLSNAERQRLEAGRAALINLTSETYPSEASRGSATFVNAQTQTAPTAPAATTPTAGSDAAPPPPPPRRRGVGRMPTSQPADETVLGTIQGTPETKAPTATGLQSLDRVKDLEVPKGLGSFDVESYKMPDKKELTDVLRQREEADRAAGVNTNIYKDLIQDLEGKKGKLAERKKEAIGNALMQTGLGLIGARRGQEFAVLSESGQRALQGLVNANEKIRETEEKIDDSRRGLLMAENDYKRTRSDKAFDDVQRNRDKIEALEIKNVDNRNTAAQKRAEIGVQLFGQQVTLQGQKVQERGQDLQRQTSLETTAMQGATSRDVARIHAVSANRPGETERLMSEYQIRVSRDGKEAADAWLSNLERVRGAGKPQNTFSFEEAMKIVANNPLNSALTPDQLAKKAQELMRAASPQQAPSNVPPVGTIQEWDGKKWRFKGGTNTQNNWEQVK